MKKWFWKSANTSKMDHKNGIFMTASSVMFYHAIILPIRDGWRWLRGFLGRRRAEALSRRIRRDELHAYTIGSRPLHQPQMGRYRRHLRSRILDARSRQRTQMRGAGRWRMVVQGNLSISFEWSDQDVWSETGTGKWRMVQGNLVNIWVCRLGNSFRKVCCSKEQDFDFHWPWTH